jgi:DHA1 family multidrug resistance protein-like MFS transporter
LERKPLGSALIILGAVQLIESLAVALPISFFPNYVIGLGASVASVGLFTSSFMIAFAALSPKMGAITDKYGRKRLMLAGIASDVVLGTLTGLVPSWEWLLLIRVLNGAVSSGAMLASETLLMDLVEPARRGEASGFIISMNMVGQNIGPIVGGSIQWLSVSAGLSLLMSYRIPYFVDSFLAVLALIVVYYRIHEPGRIVQKPTASIENLVEPPMRLTRPLKILLVNSFMSGVGVGFIIPIMVLFYTDRFNMSAVSIGTIISVSGFIGLLASYAAGRVSDARGRKPLIGFGNYASQLASAILPFTGNITHAGVVVSLRSIGFNISMPAFRALRADLVQPQFRGRMFGLFGTAFTAGSVSGPIISTWIYSLYRDDIFNILGFKLPGYGIPFYVNAILGLISTTMIMLFIKEPTDEERAPQFATNPFMEE